MVALISLAALALSVLHAWMSFSIVGDLMAVSHDLHSVQRVARFAFIGERPWLYLPYLPVTLALLALLSPAGEFQRWYEHIPASIAAGVHVVVVMLFTLFLVLAFPFTLFSLATSAFWILAAGLAMSWAAAAATGLLD
ncbi:hypothetical protein [Cereibacter sediminicola]|uniref:hypothetical protein n=1 Tax=Cereibacter sediminicola TaxID=2584941 RepID=UPI0011A701AB|nr:hypothetical protein [Cereibacter sediminicola]